MQITFTFEAHELPSVLTQLIGMLSGDASKLAAAVMASQTEMQAPRMSTIPPVAPASPQPASVPHAAAPASNPVFFPAPEAQPAATLSANPETEPKRRGRKPKTLDPNLSVVPAADIPPAPLAMQAPAPKAPLDAQAPAQPMPAAAAPVSQVPASLHPQPEASQPAAAGAGELTVNDIRHAYVAAEMRGVTAEQVMGILAAYGVTKVRDIPADKYADAIARFNAIGA